MVCYVFSPFPSSPEIFFNSWHTTVRFQVVVFPAVVRAGLLLPPRLQSCSPVTKFTWNDYLPWGNFNRWGGVYRRYLLSTWKQCSITKYTLSKMSISLFALPIVDTTWSHEQCSVPKWCCSSIDHFRYIKIQRDSESLRTQTKLNFDISRVAKFSADVKYSRHAHAFSIVV